MASLLVVDDDESSRELLVLLATEDGFACESADSGAAALEHLAAESIIPDTILTDMQMPGITGESLARLLRLACGPATVLLAMSGSQPAPNSLRGYDAFLLKPFRIEDVRSAIAGRGQVTDSPLGAGPLNGRVYASLASSMPAAQLHALYTLCLDDADKRLRLMQTAAAAGDAEAFVRAAHAIKGGCGMVGATELAALAAAMETNGLPEVGNQAPFEDFLTASARLRRMLNAQTE